MKCLEKDRARRYETANGLAMDIQRHLNNEPVVAGPPSKLYRFQKTVRRNKFAFAAGAGIAAALVSGLALAVWQSAEKTRAYNRAIAAEGAAETARAREAAQRQLAELARATEAQARQEADEARTRAEANERKAQTEAARSEQVAQVLKEMLQNVDPLVALGRDTALLKDILDKTAERIGKELTNQPQVEAELRYTIGDVYLDLRSLEKAEAMHREALRLRRELWGTNHMTVFESLTSLADVLRREGRYREAEQLRRESLGVAREVQGSQHPDVARALNGLAVVLQNEARWAEGEELHRQALAIQRNVLPAGDIALAYTLDNLAVALQMQGKFAEGEENYREALTIRRKVLGDDNPAVALTIVHQAIMLDRQGRLPEAENLFRDALAVRKKILGEEHPDVLKSTGHLVTTLLKQGKLAEAEGLCRETLPTWNKKLNKQNAATVLELADLLSRCLSQEGKTNEVEALYRDELATLRFRLGPDEPRVADMLASETARLLAKGDLIKAEPLASECLSIRQKAIPDNWKTFSAQNLLGGILLAEKKYVEAEPLLISAYEGMSKREGSIPWTGRGNPKAAVLRLLQLYDETGRPEQAAKWRVERVNVSRRVVERHRKAATAGRWDAMNDFAWLLATSDVAEVRDGRTALTYAERAVTGTSRTNAMYLDTLAAAHAEAGEFAKAVSVQKEAIALAQAEYLRKDLTVRLKLYESNTPYRER